MKKTKAISTIAVFSTLFASNVSQAIDFTDTVYGRMHLTLGASRDVYQGDARDQLYKSDADGENRTFKKTYAVNFGVGYNVYFKRSYWLSPFVGLAAEARFPFGDVIPAEGFNINNYFSSYVKLGARINLNNKRLSLDPYFLIGVNLTKVDRNKIITPAVTNDEGTITTPAVTQKKTDLGVGPSIGGGADLVFANWFTVGLEYKYAQTNVSQELGLINLKQHQLTARFGVQFL